MDKVIIGLRSGKIYARRAWLNEDTGKRIGLQEPDDGSKMNQPYIYVMTGKCEFTPWIPDYSDLLATDWFCYGKAE